MKNNSPYTINSTAPAGQSTTINPGFVDDDLEEKITMHVKIILSTLKTVMKNCDTYEEFKEHINNIFKEKL